MIGALLDDHLFPHHDTKVKTMQRYSLLILPLSILLLISSVFSEEQGSDSLLTSNDFLFSQDEVTRGAMSFPSFRSLQIWGNVYYISEKIKEKEEIPVPKHDILGAMVGLNKSIGRIWTFTGYYNYNQGTYQYEWAQMRQTTHLGGAGVYCALGNFYMHVLGGWGLDNYKLSNEFEEEKEEATEGEEISLKGWQGTGLFEVGYDMQTRGLFSLKPFTGLQYCYLQHNDFDILTLEDNDEKVKYDTLYYLLGARLDVNLRGMDQFAIQGRLSWVRDLMKEEVPLSNYWFGRIPGTVTPTQLSTEGIYDKSFFWAGAGIRLATMSHFCFTVDYDALIASRKTAHILSAGLVVSF